MPLNDRKVIAIILKQCELVEERYPGYRREVVNAVASIVKDERDHRVQPTHIQKKVDDRCGAVALLLAQARDQANPASSSEGE